MKQYVTLVLVLSLALCGSAAVPSFKRELKDVCPCYTCYSFGVNAGGDSLVSILECSSGYITSINVQETSTDGSKFNVELLDDTNLQLRINGKSYTPSWSAQSVTCVNRAITNAYTSITKLNLVSKCLNSWFDCPMKRDASVTCSSTPQPTPSPTPSPTPTPTPSPTPTPKHSPKRSFSTVSPTDYTGYWVGTWKVSPQCDQTTCCCLDGNVEVTKLATNSVKLVSGVKGACGSTTQFSFTINSISSSNYISTAVAGNTFTMSRTGLELTVNNQQSSACNGKATCVSGDCLSNAVSEGTTMTISVFSVVVFFLVAICFSF